MSLSGAAASPRHPASDPPQSMSIGEVLTHLRVDFPDATISKLRFLEAEGLVEPRRTASGYRQYSVDDVARLRFVLTAQRDHYLPLRVIRDQLSASDRGGDPAVWRRASLVPGGRDGLSTVEQSELRLTATGLVERADATDELLRDLREHGLVAPRPGG